MHNYEEIKKIKQEISRYFVYRQINNVLEKNWTRLPNFMLRDMHGTGE